MKTLLIAAGLLALAGQAKADCWVIPGPRGEVMGWRCDQPAYQQPAQDWTRLLAPAPTHYGPDLNAIYQQQLLRELQRQR